MKRLYLILCAFLLLIQIRNVYSQDRAWDLSESREWRDAVIPGLIATGETLFWNVLPLSFNAAIGESWALPTASSIRRNLTSRWVWEKTDDFVVNHIGHPYHGSLYFSSGRANGFGFYGSMFFSLLGSFSWEAFGESNKASFNDFVSTSVGSVSIGEILYRLYAEAHAAGIPAPLAFIINPTAGLNRLLTGWKPSAGRNLYRFQVSLGMGYAETGFLASRSGLEWKAFSFKGPFVGIGIKAVYGNPFEQSTWVPYRHFELATSLAVNPGSYSDFRITSEGYLFSFSPVYTEKNAVSTGLSLHFDFVSLGKFSARNSTISQFNNALAWTIKYQHLFSQDTALQVKLHAGYTFMGASNYYSPLTKNKDLNNYGYGLTIKRSYRMEHGKRDVLELDRYYYIMWTYPGRDPYSQGAVHWQYSNLSYSHFISEDLSLGISIFSAKENGTYNWYPETRKRNEAVMLFVAWNL